MNIWYRISISVYSLKLSAEMEWQTVWIWLIAFLELTRWNKNKFEQIQQRWSNWTYKIRRRGYRKSFIRLRWGWFVGIEHIMRSHCVFGGIKFLQLFTISEEGFKCGWQRKSGIGSRSRLLRFDYVRLFDHAENFLAGFVF